MSKILLAVTTYNQLEYTKLFYETYKLLNNDNIDLIIFDDASTDGTPLWCFDNDIKCHSKDEPEGLTNSWNMAYKIFKTRTLLKDEPFYDYLIIANNDILIPKGSIEELIKVAEKWPFSVITPMSTTHGAGHNGIVQGIEQKWPSIFPNDFLSDYNNYQLIQDHILKIKNIAKEKNDLFVVDPIRMKMFNGFFFMMTRNVIDYEKDSGVLFDETKPLYAAEDEFNWRALIPNNDFPAVCRTSFIYHFKGQSTKNFGVNDNENFLKKREKLDNEDLPEL